MRLVGVSPTCTWEEPVVPTRAYLRYIVTGAQRRYHRIASIDPIVRCRRTDCMRVHTFWVDLISFVCICERFFHIQVTIWCAFAVAGAQLLNTRARTLHLIRSAYFRSVRFRMLLDIWTEWNRVWHEHFS